jgi:hypothetical protein
VNLCTSPRSAISGTSGDVGQVVPWRQRPLPAAATAAIALRVAPEARDTHVGHAAGLWPPTDRTIVGLTEPGDGRGIAMQAKVGDHLVV